MNNQETERLWVNVEADERTMREIYFPAFQAVVQKRVQSRSWALII